MNYQTEGRMLELNQAKFSTNGNCGYILKPKWMIKGVWMCRFVFWITFGRHKSNF